MKNLIILSAVLLSSLANAKNLGRVELSSKSILLPDCGGNLSVAFKPNGTSNDLVLKIEGDSKCTIVEKMKKSKVYFLVNPKKSEASAHFSKNNKIYIRADIDYHHNDSNNYFNSNSSINLGVYSPNLRHIMLKFRSEDNSINDELEIHYKSLVGTRYEVSMDQPTEENRSNILEKNKLYSLPNCGGYAYLNPTTGGGMLETYTSVVVFGIKSNLCNALINADGTTQKLSYDSFTKTYYGSIGYSYGLIHKGNSTDIELGNYVDLTRYYRVGIVGYVSPDHKVDGREKLVLSLEE